MARLRNFSSVTPTPSATQNTEELLWNSVGDLPDEAFEEPIPAGAVPGYFIPLSPSRAPSSQPSRAVGMVSRSGTPARAPNGPGLATAPNSPAWRRVQQQGFASLSARSMSAHSHDDFDFVDVSDHSDLRGGTGEPSGVQDHYASEGSGSQQQRRVKDNDKGKNTDREW